MLAGKPDLVAKRRDQITVIDAKTGRPSAAHTAQVLIYMYALPIALQRYKGLLIVGQVAYPDHVVDIPADAVDGRFEVNLGGLIRRLKSKMPPRRVPLSGECRFCEITPSDCPVWRTRALGRRARPATSEGHQTNRSGERRKS